MQQMQLQSQKMQLDGQEYIKSQLADVHKRLDGLKQYVGKVVEGATFSSRASCPRRIILLPKDTKVRALRLLTYQPVGRKWPGTRRPRILSFLSSPSPARFTSSASSAYAVCDAFTSLCVQEPETWHMTSHEGYDITFLNPKTKKLVKYAGKTAKYLGYIAKAARSVAVSARFFQSVFDSAATSLGMALAMFWSNSARPLRSSIERLVWATSYLVSAIRCRNSLTNRALLATRLRACPISLSSSWRASKTRPTLTLMLSKSQFQR